MEDSDIAQPLRLRKRLKPIKSVKVERSSQEWKILIEEAKRKEMFWIKGIVPASLDLVNVNDGEDEDTDDV